MKGVKIVLVLMFSILADTLSAQTPVGLKFDIDGQPFNGNFDPLTYRPLRKLKLVHNSDSYEQGYYYDYRNNKIKGQVKFENDKISFKETKDGYLRLGPDEVKSLVIGIDSFFVVKDFYYKNKVKDKAEFVQYIADFDGLTIAKHYHFRSTMSLNYNVEPIVETYIIKSKDAKVWDNFSHKGFEKNIIKYFGHIPYISQKLRNREYNKSDMLSIIKTAEYFNKFENSEIIYFDKYWQEVQDPKIAEYNAEIVSKKDSIWTLIYYKGKTKLYKANYSSFYPNIKNGFFISYHPNGKKRKESNYVNNKLKDEKIYDLKGDLMTHYHFKEAEYSSKYGSFYKIKYDSVMNSVGKNLLESSNAFEYSVFDDYSNAVSTSHFSNSELLSSYRLVENDTVYQITNLDYKINIKRLQKQLNKFVYDYNSIHYKDALNVNAQGISLISIIIDKKGYPLYYSMLNTVHPDWDMLLKSFVEKGLAGMSGKRPYKFKPYKKGKNNQFCEIVIPFEFKINRFYREARYYNHYYYYYNFMWQHQQMMNNSRPPSFVPPTFPTGF